MCSFSSGLHAHTSISQAHPQSIRRSLQTSYLSHKLSQRACKNLFWDISDWSILYHCMGGTIYFCTSIFEAIWQERKKPWLVTFACPFPLPSKGLLVVMSETEDMLISTDCRFISPELLNRAAQPPLSNLTWLGHTSIPCGSLHYLLWIKTKKLLNLQTPRDRAQILQKKEWRGRKSCF